MKIDALAQSLLDYALDHYDDGGWDVLVECWTVEDIVAEWRRGVTDFRGTIPRSLRGAIASFQPKVDYWADQEADTINSAF